MSRMFVDPRVESSTTHRELELLNVQILSPDVSRMSRMILKNKETEVAQAPNIDDMNLKWKVMSTLHDLKSASLIPDTESSVQPAERDTQHRAFIPRILFAHMFARINRAETVKDVVYVLDFFSLTDIADRLTYLHEIAKEEDENVDVRSVRNFSAFMIKTQLPTPQFGINLDGLIQAVWRPPHIGTLVMNFLNSGDIAFTALYAQQTPRTRRRKISGEMSPHSTMLRINDFVSGLTAT